MLPSSTSGNEVSMFLLTGWLRLSKPLLLLLAEVREANCLPSTSGNEVSMFLLTDSMGG